MPSFPVEPMMKGRQSTVGGPVGPDERAERHSAVQEMERRGKYLPIVVEIKALRGLSIVRKIEPATTGSSRAAAHHCHVGTSAGPDAPAGSARRSCHVK